ncbi:hypothetical protein SNEBB_008332 [Seison nebaliae]|nr:hypothetical protein SNEBB_008332 [Seison nebaliae]
MSNRNEQMSTSISSTLCKNNCGFYGTSENDGYCSLCHKDALTRQTEAAAPSKKSVDGVQSTTSSLIYTNVPNSNSQNPSTTNIPSDTQAPLSMRTGKCHHLQETNEKSPSAPKVPIEVPDIQTSINAEMEDRTTPCNEMKDKTDEMNTATTSNEEACVSKVLTNDKILESNTTDVTKVNESNQNSPNSQLNGKRKRIRCPVCNKRLPPGQYYTCRCGGQYCSKHRYDGEHGCTYDYREEGKAKIKIENPQVIGEKLRKI